MLARQQDNNLKKLPNSYSKPSYKPTYKTTDSYSKSTYNHTPLSLVNPPLLPGIPYKPRYPITRNLTTK